MVVNDEEHDPLPTMSKLDLPYNISSDTDKFLAGQNGGPVFVISDASDAQTNLTHVETQAAQPLMFCGEQQYQWSSAAHWLRGIALRTNAQSLWSKRIYIHFLSRGQF